MNLILPYKNLSEKRLNPNIPQMREAEELFLCFFNSMPF